MKKIFFCIVLSYSFLMSCCVIEQCWQRCTLVNCIIVAILLQNVWQWHTTSNEIIFCEQEIKNNNDLNVELWQNRYSAKEHDFQEEYYGSLKRTYAENVRLLNLRQIRATIKKEQSLQGILSGIKENIVKLC